MNNRLWIQALCVLLFSPLFAEAMPHYREDLVPRDLIPLIPVSSLAAQGKAAQAAPAGDEVFRFDVEWQATTDQFFLSALWLETSGTEALLRRSSQSNPLGSYHGVLEYSDGSRAYDSLGTGSLFRRLSRGLAFRFPRKSNATPQNFRVLGEDPQTGEMREMLNEYVAMLPLQSVASQPVSSRLLRAARSAQKLVITFYAEGYQAHQEATFWRDCERAIAGLEQNSFAMLDHFEFVGVFAPSNERMRVPSPPFDPTVPVKDSFLGLEHPYWERFGRWSDVVYPTRIARYRNALAQAPYDYPIALVDSNDYWGVGNFNEITAVPTRNSYFSYLLIHELGHYFGLNEEYEGGGRTELEFSANVHEPFSQNMTFLRDGAGSLKWARFVSANTPVPTPRSEWRNGNYGAYQGGYADSPVNSPFGHNFKPGHSCVMGTFDLHLCSICAHGIRQKVEFDLGL